MFGKITKQQVSHSFHKAKKFIGHAYNQTKGFLNHVDHGAQTFKQIWDTDVCYVKNTVVMCI